MVTFTAHIDPALLERASALRSTAASFARLAGNAPDPQLAVPATPGWSLTDVVGHISTEPARYLNLASGGDDRPVRADELAAFNAERLADLPSRDLGALLDLLDGGLEELLTTLARASEMPTMNFDGNQPVRADLGLGILLSELLVHGHDVAAALGQPWPIDPLHVALAVEGVNQVLPGFVDPRAAAGHTATYEYRLRGLARHTYVFRDGVLTVNPPDHPRPDVHISADPVTALLLNYGRIGPLRPAVTGKVRAWGRKPWLALRLQRLFYAP